MFVRCYVRHYTGSIFFLYCALKMSLSKNDPDLAILNGKIHELENEISAYKDGLTIQEIRNSAEHRAYLNPLNGPI